MNIFETIQRAQPNRIEPFHSQFLVDALKENPSLFKQVWQLAAPEGWKPPSYASTRVAAEERLEEGRRIDICICSDDSPKRVIGIEVKTTDASAESDQLERYLDDLVRKFPEYDVRVSYLTPFNKRQAIDEMGEQAAGLLHTVRLFDQFKLVCPDAKHFTWRDVTKIAWDDSVLWRQHRDYVLKCMLPEELKRMDTERDRDIAHFFGEEATRQFWERLAVLGVHPSDVNGVINLAPFEKGLASFAKGLVSALEALLESNNVLHNVSKPDEFPNELRRPFLDSSYREVHAALFNLSQLFSHVWVKGTGNYGVRVAHKDHQGSGVSLVTSLGYDRLVVRLRR